VVVSPIADSPADRAGIRSLDQILAIDGISTAGMSLDECAERMRGAIGSVVQLLVGRPMVNQKNANAVSAVRPRNGHIGMREN
jgi:carboxyl-terminal processing protease